MIKNKVKASILGATLIILGIVLVTALSVSLVSIRERKASIGASKSGIAFQNAQSGVEVVMNDILKNGHTMTNQLANCNAATGKIVAGDGSYEAQLKDVTGNPVACNSATALSNIDSIKSVGINSDQKRAIEAAVAASGLSCPSIGGTWIDMGEYCIHADENSTSENFFNAMKKCTGSTVTGHLCSLSEWFGACIANPSGLRNMSDDNEWLDEIGSAGINGETAKACTGAASDVADLGWNTSHVFRCCANKR